jgi:putative flippase GtrA
MLTKLKSFITTHYDILSYLFFGVLTTLVNWLVYFPCYNQFSLSAAVSSAISWVAAVAFAYLTNKPFVFKSHDWSAKVVLPELTRFVSCRIGSGAAEMLILYLTVDVLGWNGNLWKLLISVLVVVLNYVGSKLFVFKKPEGNTPG